VFPPIETRTNDWPKTGETPARKVLRWATLACVLGVAIHTSEQQQAAAQTKAHPSAAPPPAAEILSSYDGQNVVSIDVAGRPQAEASRFASLLAQKPGTPFSLDEVNRSVDAVKAASRSQEVRVKVEPEAKGLRVLLVLEPAAYIGLFRFPGAERFPYSRLLQASNYMEQAPYNPAETEDDRQKLITFFRQEGYFEAAVETEVQFESEQRIANVTFHATLGRKAKFGDVDMAGVDELQSATLKHSIQSLLARLRGAAIRRGRPYHHSSLNKATQLLQSELDKKGFLGARVRLVGAEYHADTNLANIHFNIRTGELTDVKAHICGRGRGRRSCRSIRGSE